MQKKEQTNSFVKHPLITMLENAGNAIDSYSKLISFITSFHLLEFFYFEFKASIRHFRGNIPKS